MQGEIKGKKRGVILFPIISFFAISFIVFSLSYYSSGDIALFILSENANSENAIALSEEIGMKRGFLVQYAEFLKDFFTLSWGENLSGYSIRRLIAERAAASFEIMLITLFFSLSFSIVISCFSVKNSGKLLDKCTNILTLCIFSLPSFTIALLLILLFAIALPVFPVGGFIPLSRSLFGNIRTLFLPSLTLSLMHSALFIRVLKKSLKREMGKMYIMGAIARGKRKEYVVFTEALRPASLSLVALASEAAASLIAGSAVTETVFSIPGIGSLLVSACMQRDVKTETVIIMLISLFVSLTSIISKSVMASLDKRALEGV